MSDRQRYSHADILRTGAELYLNGIINPRMSGEDVVSAIATHQIRTTLQLSDTSPVKPEDELALATRHESVKRMLTRNRQGSTFIHRFWHDLISHAQQAAVDPDHPGILTDLQISQLTTELVTGDPQLAAVHAALQHAVHTTGSDSSGVVDAAAQRQQWCEHAATLLDDTTPSARTDPDRNDPAAEARRINLEQISTTWARVYEATVGEHGHPTVAQTALAEHAVRAGYQTQQRALRLRTQVIFGQRASSTPTTVHLHSTSRGGRWLAASAALHALSNVPPKEILDRTRNFAATLDASATAHTGTLAGSLSDTAILTQAGWTLLAAGRRHLADAAVTSAWAAGTDIPDELLDLSIELASHQYAHGEHHAAAATLHPHLQQILSTDPGGDPDGAGWGEVVSYIFYRRLLTAQSDPPSAIGPLREDWVQALTDSISTAYPSKWLLAGVLVELLITCGDVHAASTVAAISRTHLYPPTTPAEQQLRAHLSEMIGTNCTASDTRRSDAADLLERLTILLVTQPDALSHSSRLTLQGLARLSSSSHARRRRTPTT